MGGLVITVIPIAKYKGSNNHPLTSRPAANSQPEGAVGKVTSSFRFLSTASFQQFNTKRLLFPSCVPFAVWQVTGPWTGASATARCSEVRLRHAHIRGLSNAIINRRAERHPLLLPKGPGEKRAGRDLREI